MKKVKAYNCTDCNEISYLEDNGEIRVGFCKKCGHPLWNPANDEDNESQKHDESSPILCKDKEEEIKRILMNNFTRGDIKRATEQLVNLLKS